MLATLREYAVAITVFNLVLVIGCEMYKYWRDR